MGVDLGPDEVAFRCNLVTVDDAGRAPWSTSPPGTSRASRPLRSSRRSTTRSATVATACASTPVSSTATSASCPRPRRRRVRAPARSHRSADRAARPVRRPRSSSRSMDASRPVVAAAAADVGSVATQIWLWGQGTRPRLPDFAERYGVDGRLSSAVDLVRGLGVLVGHRGASTSRARPPASTTTTPRSATPRCASLADRDFFLLHVEATDEAGHQGAIDEKVRVARAVGRRDHRAARRRARRHAAPHPPAARPRHAVRGSAPTPRTPVPYLLLRLRVAGARAASTPRPRVAGATPVPAHDLDGARCSPDRPAPEWLAPGVPERYSGARRRSILSRPISGRIALGSWQVPSLAPRAGISPDDSSRTDNACPSSVRPRSTARGPDGTREERP